MRVTLSEELVHFFSSKRVIVFPFGLSVCLHTFDKSHLSFFFFWQMNLSLINSHNRIQQTIYIKYKTSILAFDSTQIVILIQIYFIYAYMCVSPFSHRLIRHFQIAWCIQYTFWDIGEMPIKCLSVHTATIQNIHSFSLLYCTDTEYTQWSIKYIYTITGKTWWLWVHPKITL